MAKRNATSAPQTDVNVTPGRMKNMSKSASKIVKDAAEILDDELAAGVVAAKQVQDRFRKERRVDPKDFESALQKFKADAHEVLTLVGDQLESAGSKDNADLTRSLMGKTHDVLNLTIEMINIGAELADQLAQKTKPSTGSGRAENSVKSSQ